MGVKLEDLLNENKESILEDKSKKTIKILLRAIICVFVIIIIAIGFSIIKSGRIKVQERAKQLSTDIDLISAYIKNVYTEYRADGDESRLIGRSLEGDRVEPFTIVVNKQEQEYKYGYYYVTAEQIKNMISTLNIENEDYVLNYSTGDVINVVGVRLLNGKTYYSVDDLKAIRDEKTPPSDNTVYINSAADMVKLHENPNGYFKLNKDIDMSAYSTGDGWKPVPEFSGKFDGRGYVIKGLIVSRAAERYCGLFGQVKNGASIVNLKLENVNVAGGEFTGAIAGSCSGNISNCKVTGNVNSQSSFVGGIFGIFENGIAQNIISNVTVNGNENVGGFVGSIASGTIQACSATGNVTGIKNVGGFTGLINPTKDTQVKQVRSEATIVANENAGGFVGSVIANASHVSLLDSYSVGKITSCLKVSGGFVGNLTTNVGSEIKFASLYTSVDTPSMSENRGGFAGTISATGSSNVLRCFWERDNLLDVDLNSIGTTNNQGIEFESHTPNEMKNTSTFEGWDVEVWNFDKDGRRTPILRWE